MTGAMKEPLSARGRTQHCHQGFDGGPVDGIADAGKRSHQAGLDTGDGFYRNRERP